MSENRLTPTLDLENLSPDEAFAILGDETRLDIIRVLWGANAMRVYDDIDETETVVRYSELRSSIDIDDNGKLNYHLSELRPHFVTKTSDGYRLSEAGKRIARTVVAVSGPKGPVRTEVDASCPLCGGEIEGSYEDSWLRFRCTECEGLFGDAVPEGVLLNENFPPAAVASGDMEAVYQTKLYRCVFDMIYLMQGICRECASSIHASVTVCDDHVTAAEPCPACGQHSEAWAELRCRTCRFAKRLPVELCALGLMPTLWFLYERGINLFDPTLERMVGLIEHHFRLTVLENPRRFEVTITFEDDSFSLVLDEQLELIEQ